MNPDLACFLGRHTPLVQETMAWRDGRLPLCVTCYRSDELPPLEYVTSVRGLLLREGSVLVVRDPRTTHLLPGGRREAGETLEETLRREVLEETGWELEEPSMLGFIHFQHHAPSPGGYRYPHPDFLQVVYRATAGAYFPEARHVQDRDTESRFHSIADVQALGLAPSQCLYLEAALSSRCANRVLARRDGENRCR
jgi:8-oxo-dGTP pyrophosphatase MutT (NUDIX family)